MPESELEPTSFSLQSPNAEVPADRLLEPSESELNTITPWWPLPGIAGVSPESREPTSGAPALSCSGSVPQPVHLWGRGDQAGSNGAGALGARRREPPDDSMDKGSSVTEGERGGASKQRL